MRIVLLVFSLFCSSLAGEEYYLSVISIFHNDAPYLKEWIEFYRLQGVDHFLLYNHLSEDEYLSVLQPYIDEGIVELVEWPRPFLSLWNWRKKIQLPAYRDALAKLKDRTFWIAMVDSDEFIFPTNAANLSELLKSDYESFPSLFVNWQMYGTSNVERILKGQLMIELLCRKARVKTKINSWGKSIYQPKYVVDIINPHYPVLEEGMHNRNESGEVVTGYRSPVSVKTIRVNHYWTRDEDFFEREKRPRLERGWWADSNEIDPFLEKLNEVEDRSISRFIPELKKRLEGQKR